MRTYWHQDDQNDDPRVENAAVDESVRVLMRDGWEFRDVDDLEREFPWTADDEWRAEMRTEAFKAKAQWWVEERSRMKLQAQIRRRRGLEMLRSALCQFCGGLIYGLGEVLNRVPSHPRMRCKSCGHEHTLSLMRAAYRRRAWSNDLARMSRLLAAGREKGDLHDDVTEGAGVRITIPLGGDEPPTVEPALDVGEDDDMNPTRVPETQDTQ